MSEGKKMRITTILLLLVLIGWIAILPQAKAETYTDDFNRTTGLGANWTADPEYKIVSNTLDNTATTASWSYLAVYNAVANPTEVSFKWASTSDQEGRNSGGIAVYLSAAATNASGYFVFRRDGTIFLHPVINGDVQRQTIIAQTAATRNLPAAGDVIKVVPTSTATAHHFDFYVNGALDGRVSDTQKLFGSGATLYAGVSLYGNRTNNIDDFTVKAPSIVLTSPNGGEVWIVNSSHNILWSSSDFTGNVKLEYSVDSGSNWTTIIASTSNTGSYAWTIPNAPSQTCKVRISDASDGAPSDVSNDTFKIEPETEEVTVLSPNGGESWVAGSNQNITWHASSIIPNVKLSYSVGYGLPRTWTVITASTPNDGSFAWTAPTQFTNQASIKIEDAMDGLPSDTSDAAFSIVALVSLSIPDASGEPSIVGPPEIVKNGIINLWMNNQVNVRALIFTLQDSIFDPLTAPKDYLTQATAIGVGRATNFVVDYSNLGTDPNNPDKPDSVRIMLVSYSGAIIPVGNGPIAQITYKIRSTAPLHDHSMIRISKTVMVADGDNQLVVPSLNSGKFYFVRLGDLVSPDGIDAADLDAAIDLVIPGTTPPSSDQLLSGDMDHDGDLDLFDVLGIFDLL